MGDLAAEEGDSILTTATNATATRKMAKGKKTTAKGRKTKVKKAEPAEITPVPEPEEVDVKEEGAPKPTRGRKRKTEDTVEAIPAVSLPEAPAAKRRATRTRGSVAIDDSILDESTMTQEVSKATKPGRKGRPSTRKTSTASIATVQAPIPNDDEIDAALEADLARQVTDEEDILVSFKKSARSNKASRADHAMFGIDPVEIDEVEIEAELTAMEVDSSKPLPKAKGAKAKQSRKVSAKQQAAARKAVEAEVVAQKIAQEHELQEDDPSEQIAEELEHSISMQHSSPVIQPKRQQTSSRQPPRQMPGRGTRASAMSVNDSTTSVEVLDQNEDLGNETDASMASQSTVVRGGKSRRGSTLKKSKTGKKGASKNIEEIVKKSVSVFVGAEHSASPLDEEMALGQADDKIMGETFSTPAPEAVAVAVVCILINVVHTPIAVEY